MSSWLAQPIPTTPKTIQMTFYGSLGLFKVIFDKNQIFRDSCTLGVGAEGEVFPGIGKNHQKSSKIIENQQK